MGERDDTKVSKTGPAVHRPSPEEVRGGHGPPPSEGPGAHRPPSGEGRGTAGSSWPLRRVFFLVLGIGGVLLSGLKLAALAPAVEREGQMTRWPKTTGRGTDIVLLDVNVYVTEGGGTTLMRCAAVQRYTFEVGGRKYEGPHEELINPRLFLNRGVAESWRYGVRSGGPVTVFYDPKDPARNCADRPPQGLAGKAFSSYVTALIVSVLFLAGGIFNLKFSSSIGE